MPSPFHWSHRSHVSLLPSDVRQPHLLPSDAVRVALRWGEADGEVAGHPLGQLLCVGLKGPRIHAGGMVHARGGLCHTCVNDGSSVTRFIR